jgi:GNAT superfamily N-acetyltransferase
MAGQDLAFMLRLTQAMEDAWVACRLEHHWDHPLNMGWVNLFARWTGTATFRSWWPLIAPMYASGFARFLAQRLGMRHARRVVGHGSSRGLPHHRTPPLGLARTLWERSGAPVPWRHQRLPDGVETRYFQLSIAPAEAVAGAESYQVGLTALRTRRDDAARAWVAGWTSGDFFVPPSLWGAGYGGMMLEGLLAALVGTCDRCVVCVPAPADDDDHRVARIDERAFIEQYRRYQFQQLPDDDAQRDIVTQLGFTLGAHDTVLVKRMAVEQRPGTQTGPWWPAV